MKQRKLRLSLEEKKQLNDIAWYLRTDVSKLLRQKIELYADGKLPSALFPRTGERTEQFTFFVDSAIWDAAMERARRENVELSAIIRNAALAERLDTAS